MKILTTLFDNKYISFVFRIILGATFVYASMDKILYPGEFAEAVQNYQILPIAVTNLFALVLPWLELIAGIFLLNGFRIEASNMIIFGLILMFIVAIVVTMIRGIDIECGCFSTGTGKELGFMTLASDIILLIMSIVVFYFNKGYFSIDRLLQN